MRASIRSLFLAAIAACLAVAAVHGRPQAPAGSASLDARIAHVERGLLPRGAAPGAPGARLADRMAVHAVPGVSIAVINDGVVEWARGYGVVEAGARTPVTPRTLFQAASISKPVASLAALLLVAQGRLSLDEPVNARLVSWKVPANQFTAAQPVTLRRLLSHTAGLTVHGFPGYEVGRPVPTLVQVLDGRGPANTDAIRVDVMPGTVNRYSGGGYTVVQQLLVDVTRKPFPALLSELVLRPIAMTDSTYEQPLAPGLRGEAASGHDGSGKPIRGRYHTYPEMAAAGLWTTPTDLARFAIELQHALAGTSRVIPPATASAMTTRQLDDYGLGLSIGGSSASARFGHGGANAGFRCEMTAFAAAGKGAVVMTNGDNGGALAAEILRAIAREYSWPVTRRSASGVPH